MLYDVPDGGNVAKVSRLNDPCSESSIFGASGHHPPSVGWLLCLSSIYLSLTLFGMRFLENDLEDDDEVMR